MGSRAGPPPGMLSGMHVAQINVGRLLAPLDDPRIAGFKSQLDAMNALADASPGFVWRLVGSGNNATDLRPYEDPTMLVNMSVWESIEALRGYVYRSQHGQFVRARAEWFEKLSQPIYALWWVPVGHIPGVAEGMERLDDLRAHGPSDRAFWFPRPSPQPRVILET
jgi:hypothetical protein